MKRIFFTLLLLVITFSAVAQPQRGSLKRGVVQSELLGVEKPYVVYLPANYDSLSTKKYPVLYLLHGAWGHCEDWVSMGDVTTTANRVIGSGMAREMIIVMPDARGEGENYAGKNMGYFNYENWPYEDFFFEEFIPEIESRYNIISSKETRAICGLSMGGGGAAAYAQRHPEYFIASAPLSGVLSAREKTGTAKINSQYADAILKTSPSAFLQNASEEDIEAMRTIKWWVDCGDDDFLAAANLEFYTEMKRLAIPFEFRMRDGEHNWHYWSTALPDVLTFVSLSFVNSTLK